MLKYAKFLISWLILFSVGWCDSPIRFDRDIAPLLSRRCLGCHRGEDAEGKLDLSHKDAALRGGENGVAIVSGKATDSLIWQRVAAGEMPEDEPLPEAERMLLRRWIDEGARWGTDVIDPFQFSSDARAGYDWWSLQPLQDVRPPAVLDHAWAKNAIDTFVFAKLTEQGIAPSPPAAPRELVRRVYYDIVGLPPSPALLNSNRLTSHQQLVDRLLASPQYGQRWARHWLDVVRFGESHGFEYNQPRNHFWPYRNWVIDAFNRDLRYDEFVRQQLAGDILLPEERAGRAAVGFLVAGPHNTTKPSSDKMRRTMRHDELEDIVGTIGQTFLGLTINCARCHDHKFDPITQREYYQLVAAVVGIDHGEHELSDLKAKQAKRELETLRDRIKQLDEQLKGVATAEATGVRAELGELKKQHKSLQATRAPKIYTAISRKPPKVSRLRRGDVTLPAEEVSPGGIRAVNAALAEFQLSSDSSDSERRVKLAEWVTADQNALLARVIVNRLWHYHFGQGLVRSPSDFGFNGDRPSHPELLDYLAGQLIRYDWHLKPIQRLILTSATYQQSSAPRAEAVKRDADNRWLWRKSPRRLTAEEIRDSMLFISGQLDDRLGGVGYRDMKEYKYRGSHYYDPILPDGPDSVRRTVYRFSPRGAKRTILDTFDCPDPSAKAPKRAVTITPLQALSLMNNQFVLDVSEAIAKRIADKFPGHHTQVAAVYRFAYGREPLPDELGRVLEFVEAHGLTSFCRVVLNSNEFLYVR